MWHPIIRAKRAALSLLCLLLLPTQGCHRTLTPDEVFRGYILDPIPASVTHLQGHYVPLHEWSAWLRFSAPADDLARIVTALDAREVGWSEFDHVLGEFSEAPEALRPPKDWFRRCVLYEGIGSKGPVSYIAVRPDTGEVFVSLQQI